MLTETSKLEDIIAEAEMPAIKVERVLPFQRYTGYQIATIIRRLPQWVAEGKSPSTLLIGQWHPKTLSLPRSQIIEDVNLKACKEAGVHVTYIDGGGRAFLNTDKELYFMLAAPTQKRLDVTGQYELVANAVVEALREHKIDAYLDRRYVLKDGKEVSDSHDIKVGSGETYWTNKLAVLAGNSYSVRTDNGNSYAFLRHGSIFLRPYDEDEFELMLDLMNVPPDIPKEKALAVMKQFPTYAKQYNPDLNAEELSKTIAEKFGAIGDWKKEEWSTIKTEASIYQSAATKYDDKYFKKIQRGFAKSRGLCMLPWGFLPDWNVGAYDVKKTKSPTY